jgi:glycosyltransferase involved in cell wall biosynthesis
VIRDGETGWLVRERTTAALAARMREVAENAGSAKQRGEAAHRYVEAEHRIERMCAGYREAYASLM